MTKLTVAAAQVAPVPGDVAANVAQSVARIHEAAAKGVQLVVFPELSLIGYRLDLLDRPDVWIAEGDARLEPIREAVIATGVTAAVGAAWREVDGTPRIATLVFRPDGSMELVFKMHVHASEDVWFTSAPYPPKIVEVGGWNVAFAICFDAANPEHAMAAKEAGAEIYADSGLYVTSEIRRLDLHFGARAMDERMFSLFANSTGVAPDWESCGRSGTWGPDGEVRVTSGLEEGLVIDTFDRAEFPQWLLQDTTILS